MRIEYIPPGPVAAAFLRSDAFVRGIMGPVGSGKSSVCCMDLVSRALEQKPGPDGIARTRAVVVRNTLPELKSTTIKTWLDWFPEHLFGKIRYDPPITYNMVLSPTCHFEVIFLAMDRPDDARKLLSLETTWIWFNEAREFPFKIFSDATSRVGRYPPARLGGATHNGIIMDTNPPTDDHWWYRLAEVERPEGYEFFRQPSGLSKEAENLNWLEQTEETIKLPLNHPDRIAQGRKYYLKQLPGKPPEWVKVMIEGQYGTIIDGRPVFPEFNDNLHVSAVPLKPIKGIPLYLGFDFGLTPACVITQLTPRGQLRVLDECVGFNTGLQQFLDTMLKPLLVSKYDGFKIISVHDPAGVQRSQANEVTCRHILKAAGLNPSTVGTNDFTARREAVAWFLTRLVDGEPAIKISSECSWLRKGLNGAYRFKKIRTVEELYKEVPEKSKASHICEALQYVCLHHYSPGIDVSKRRRFVNKPYIPALSAGY